MYRDSQESFQKEIKEGKRDWPFGRHSHQEYSDRPSMTFDPKALKYDKDGVPFLSAAEIEGVAHEVLQKYHPEALRTPCFTKVAEILQGLNQNTGLLFTMADLGHAGKAKILGKVNFSKKVLALDHCLSNEMKSAFRFTAGHEIGHWVLHRHKWRDLNLSGYYASNEELTDDDTTLCRLEKRSGKDWLEFQANVFAASLVMPTKPFERALIEAQKSLGIQRNLGVIFLNEDTTSSWDYQQTVAILSHQFDVSKESVRVRLRTRQLIVEDTKKQVRSAKQLLTDSLGDF